MHRKDKDSLLRSVPGRLIAGVAALLVLGALAIVGVLVAARSGGSSATAVATAPGFEGPEAAFPAPPPRSVVFARSDGTDALALALTPGERRLGLQASVVGGNGAGVRGLAVAFSIERASGNVRVAAKACGPGCYRATAPLPSAPRSVTVDVERAARTTTWRVPIETWPPRPAGALVLRAERVWRGLRTFQFSERLASSPENVVNSHWTVVAPDRLSYRIDGGGAAIIVGSQRWDRQRGRWRKLEQAPLELPQPTWGTDKMANAYLLGAGTVGGEPVWRVSFYDPSGRAWFEAAIAKRTFRTLELTMTATAHFMHQSFSRFDAPLTVRPPAS
jgi:hypothetical protein